MSNFRRHFNFVSKSTLEDHRQGKTMPLPPPDMAHNTHFKKCNLMDDICNCLELCCSYIQTLNSLCGAGTLLAENFLQTVQEVPAFRSVAQQFLAVWEEVGKATAGASAAVKTETLMMLQEVLNSLEADSSHAAMDVIMSNSFQDIGSCLLSFIELQAAFSLSTWKSLSKLSKNLTDEAFQSTLRSPSGWKLNERNSFKVLKHSDWSTTIKKHFSQLFHKFGISKTSQPNETSSQSQFYVPPTSQNKENPPVCGNYSAQTDLQSSAPSDSIIWSPSTTLWPTSNSSVNNVPHLSHQQFSENKTCSPPPTAYTELDEVINLLSCMPIRSPVSQDYHSSQSPKTFETSPKSQHLKRFWPEGSAPMLSRHMTSHRSWSEGTRDITFGYDSWIWRSDNLNCAALPEGDVLGPNQNDPNLGKISDPSSTWNNVELQSLDHMCRWNTATVENGSSSDDGSSNPGHEGDPLLLRAAKQCFGQRRTSSSSNLPDGQDELFDLRQQTLWDTHSHKTSTWPLKQSSSKMFNELEYVDEPVPDNGKYIPMYFNYT